MPSFVTGKGQVLQVGRELGRGGEGSVFEVPSNSALVAKLYHKGLYRAKQSKLAFMAATADAKLLSYAAWPQETLHERSGGPVVGFLMPKVADRQPVHMLYSPKHRRQDYPDAAWNFLLVAARNMAAAFAAVHEHGHVIGDVNQGNVLVGKDAKVVFIDCDSFQVSANGQLHLCEVGVSHFTPPELQGLPSFNGVKRTANHDNFGLALLIFHTLLGGRHPFAGVPLGHDGGELEPNIKAFRFAYARDAQSRGIAAPPNSIPLSLVSDPIEAMFTQAFTERGVNSRRPTALEWVGALDGLRNGLKKCSVSRMHVYPSHLMRCPWCELENKGIVYFIDLGATFAQTATGFSLAQTWALVEAVKPPPAPTIPNVATLTVTATPVPGGSGEGQKWAWRAAIVIGALILFSSAPKASFFTLIGAIVAWFIAGSAGSSERQAERLRRMNALDAARKEFEELEAKAKQVAGPEAFMAKRRELESLRSEYQRLPEVEKDALQQLHATAEQRQKEAFLDRCFIDAATISGVGNAKKAALRSFGIETAADVSWSKVKAVRGFGDVLTRAVVDWKKSCERRFVFDPRNAVSEADKNAVRAKVATRMRVIEGLLGQGPAELRRLQTEAVTSGKSAEPRLSEVAQRYAKAKANAAVV